MAQIGQDIGQVSADQLGYGSVEVKTSFDSQLPRAPVSGRRSLPAPPHATANSFSCASGTLSRNVCIGAAGFSNRELRSKHREQYGVPLKSSQASYRMRIFFRTHSLIEPVGGHRRYQLTRAGRPIVAFLVKLYRYVLTPITEAATDGIHQFRAAIADDPIAAALHSLFITLGIAHPRPLAT